MSTDSFVSSTLVCVAFIIDSGAAVARVPIHRNDPVLSSCARGSDWSVQPGVV